MGIRSPEEAGLGGFNPMDPFDFVEAIRRDPNFWISLLGGQLPASRQDLLFESAMGMLGGPLFKGGKTATKVIDMTSAFQRPAREATEAGLFAMRNRLIKEGIEFSVPKNIQTAMRQVDNLGFDTPKQAAKAIVSHHDWAKRFDFTDVDPSMMKLIENWRRKELTSNPELAALVEKNFKLATSNAPGGAP